MHASTELELITQAQQGDQDAMAQLIESNQRLVRYAVRRMGRDGSQREDIEQAAALGIIDAVLSFDIDRNGVSLAQYAGTLVLNEASAASSASVSGFAVPRTVALRYSRCVKASQSLDDAQDLWCDEGGSPEAFVSVHNALTGVYSIHSMTGHGDDGEDEAFDIEDPGAAYATPLVDTLAAKRTLAAGMAALSERERLVLEMSAGLNGYPDDLTDGQIALALGVDRTRINHIKKRAMNKVREALTNQEEVA